MHSYYRPQTKFAKVMFYTCVSVNWVGIPACLAAGLRGGGGGIPACLAGFQAHTKGEVEGSGGGGLQAHTQGGSWGVWPGEWGVCSQGGVSPSWRLLLMHSCSQLVLLLSLQLNWGWNYWGNISSFLKNVWRTLIFCDKNTLENTLFPTIHLKFLKPTRFRWYSEWEIQSVIFKHEKLSCKIVLQNVTFSLNPHFHLLNTPYFTTVVLKTRP